MFYLKNEVNAIKWDPQGHLLASCSDDMSLRVSYIIVVTIVSLTVNLLLHVCMSSACLFLFSFVDKS